MKPLFWLLPSLVLSSPSHTRSNQWKAPLLPTIKNITASGSGCPPNTIATIQSADLTTLTLGFDAYQAFAGPDFDPTLAQRDCLIRVEIENAPSRRRGNDVIAEVTMHGFAQLDVGSGSILTTQYQLPQMCRQKPIRGVSTQTDVDAETDLSTGVVYTKTDTVPLRAGKGRKRKTDILFIRTTVDVFVGRAGGSGTMTIDDLTIALKPRSNVGVTTSGEGPDAKSGEIRLELGEPN